MLTIVNQVSLSFVQSLACHLFPPVLVDFDMDSPLLFPATPVCGESCSEEGQRYGRVSINLSGVLGVRSP
jgi:hypothetical protein